MYMRRQFRIWLFVLTCLAALAANASAQSNRRFVIRIPFDFVVAGEALPSGNYAIERVDTTKPNVLMFKNIDNGRVRLFITQRVESEEASTSSCLIFKRAKGQFHLSQVWAFGNMDGNQMPITGGSTHDDRNTSTVVRLKTKRT